MKLITLLLLNGAWLPAFAAANETPESSVTVTYRREKVIRHASNLRARAIIPTEAGQIGINPPPAEPSPANIEGHTKYLTEEQGTTIWKGPDPSFIAVQTITTTDAAGQTGEATITKGVEAHKNDDGSLAVLLSPAVIAKLEAIHKEVVPCAPARRRSRLGRRQGGPSCGLADFVQRVGADEELDRTFAEPLNDQAWNEIDEGYESDDPTADPGWEGDGQQRPPEIDEGYFSDDDEGFFEGAEEGEAESTVETIVFGTEEEAAALGEALSGADGAANAAVFGGSTVTAGSFLAFLWKTLESGNSLHNANQIPKESIHTVTKTKSTTTSEAPSCPTETPSCNQDCVPRKDEAQPAEGTTHWKCSEGEHKDCACNPEIEQRISTYGAVLDQVVLEAIAELDSRPREPEIDCPPPFGTVPSKWFVDQTASSFCTDVMSDLSSHWGSTAYDIYGNKIPILKRAAETSIQKRSTLGKRSPPVDIDNYSDYKFFLEYEPGERDCWVPREDLCKNAYTRLVQSHCGSNSGSVNDLMVPKASIGVGCGKFSWTVESPPEPEPEPPKPTLGERQCHDPHSHSDVHSDFVDAWSGFDCRDATMKAGDPEIYWHPIGFSDLYQNYKISWIDGCTIAEEQNIMHPIEGNDDINCPHLLSDNYYLCNNGGAGGSIEAGCLRYDFYVTF